MINIHNISINYIQYGKGKDIVLLHGWRQNIEMMKPLGDPLSKHYRITILDFPGFGKSEEPTSPFQVLDYVEVLHEFIQALKIQKPVVIGHSFGGRVAICYAASYAVEKVVLFGAPCVRTKKNLTVKEKLLKKAKQLPCMEKVAEIAKNYIGSTDYKNASPIMRETLVNTINEDLSAYAKKITVPTLLIWGESDTEAPVKEARLLEALLQDGALILLPGTHYAYLENLAQVVTIILSFMKEEGSL